MGRAFPQADMTTFAICDLSRVAAVRIGLPAAAQHPPFVDWPPELRRIVEGMSVMVRGGYEVDGRDLPGISQVVSVPHRAVANALGAGIAQVGGEADQVFQDMTRDSSIAAARRTAEERALRNGADPAQLTVIEVEDLPLAYLPGNSLRVHVRVAGQIDMRVRDHARAGNSSDQC